MAAILLDGEALAAKLRAELSERVAQLNTVGVTPGLGTILVGDDGPSARYVAMKHQDCGQVGIASVHEELPGDVTQEHLESVVRSLQREPRRRRPPRPAAVAGAPRRGAHALGSGPGQGRRRAAPGEPRAPCDGRSRPASVHPGRHRRAARRIRRARERASRRDHRPGADDRPAARPLAGAEAAGLQRRGHRRAHRRGQPRRVRRPRRRRRRGGGAGEPGDTGHGQAGRCGRGSGGLAAKASACCPTSTSPSSRWRAGSRRGSAVSAR